MRLRARTAAVAFAVVSGGALVVSSGAGAAATSPKQTVLDAIAASKAVSAVHVIGSVTTGSQNIGVNVYATNANAGEGSISINGATVKIVRLGARVYFNADTAFWTSQAGASAAAYANKWVYTSAAGTDGKSFSQFLGATALFKQILSGSKVNQSVFTAGANTTVGGVPVLAINGSDSTDGTSGVIYVARQGKPYLIELKTTNSSGTGTLKFSGYNQSVHPKTPPHAISLVQLEQQAAAQAAA